MRKWYEEFKIIIGVGVMALSALAWVYSLFATKEALAEKEQNMKVYVDEKHVQVENRLDEIKNVLDRVDQRVYELNKHNR